METLIHLDTHVVVWLYGGLVEKLSSKAQECIEKHVLRISPMALLEIQYLYEIGRVTEPARRIMDDLRLRIGLETADLSFAEVVEEALKLTWTRDPFDRLIVASSISADVHLLTADEHILSNYASALWAG